MERGHRMNADKHKEKTSGRSFMRNLLCHDNSVRILKRAITRNKTLNEIEHMITGLHLSSVQFNQEFAIPQQWDLINSAVEAHRADVVRMLLDRGLSPDIRGSKVLQRREISLLQSAIQQSSHEVLRVLCSFNVKVNNICKHEHPAGFEGLSDCKSAMCCVFQKDDPDMMKLLFDDYDRSFNWTGKSVLYMACTLRAVKCSAVLLDDVKYIEHVSLEGVEQQDNFLNDLKAVPQLYDVGKRKKLSLEDTRDNLYKILHKRDNTQQEEDWADHVNKIPSLRALPGPGDVNHLKSPLRTLLKSFGRSPPVLHDMIIRRVSLFVLHGGTVHCSVVNDYLLPIFYEVVKENSYGNERLQKTEKLFFNVVSVLYNKTNSKQIIPSVLTKEEVNDFELTQNHYMVICELFNQGDHPSCASIREAFRLAILNLDIRFSQVEKTMFHDDHYEPLGDCRYMSHMVKIYLLIWPHSQYQRFLKKIQLSDITDKQVVAIICGLSKCLPQCRSLQDLTRAVILNNLCLPRTVTVERLMLLKALQDYVCLVNLV